MSEGVWSEGESFAELNSESTISLGEGELLFPDRSSGPARIAYHRAPGDPWEVVFEGDIQIRAAQAVESGFVFGGVNGLAGYVRGFDGTAICSIVDDNLVPVGFVNSIVWSAEHRVGAAFTNALGVESPPRIIWLEQR